VAATGSYVFILTMDNWGAYSMRLWRSADSGVTWTEIAGLPGYYLETIYAAGNTLFAGAFQGQGSRDYAVLSLTGPAASLSLSLGNLGSSGYLAGAAQAGGNFYVAVADQGVYAGPSGTGLSASPDTFSGAVSGIIDIAGATIAVATTNGRLYYGTLGAFTLLNDWDPAFIGGIAVFYDAGNDPSLLLLSIDGGGYYTYGYREIELTPAAPYFSSTTLHEPGGALSSIANTPRYRSTLGRRVIRSIIQAPLVLDSDQTLFASTQSQGLWKYYRSTQEWNAYE
jgi:hypothetical protein